MQADKGIQMETYTILREIADSWFMLGTFGFFVGAILWSFRPGSRKVHEDTARIPFRYEHAPAPVSGENKPAETQEP